MPTFPREIFKAYDIRGIVGKTLTPDVVRAIGQAPGHACPRKRPRHAVAIGRDGRLSGPELAAALAQGLRAAGADVIDLGMVATPMTYFAAQHLDTRLQRDGHRQPQPARLQRPQDGDRRRHALRRRHPGRCARASRKAASLTGSGAYSQHDIAPAYIDRITSDVKLTRTMTHRRGLRQRRGRRLRADALPQDGLQRRRSSSATSTATFPNHHPDPSQPKNLVDLVNRLQKGDCELGLAFDGDGDRLGVVTRDGPRDLSRSPAHALRGGRA